MDLVLASESRYRRELLDRLGLSYRAFSHTCDESAFKGGERSPRSLAEELAREKAMSLRGRFGEAWIIGSDQVLEVEGEILSKPGGFDKAMAQLRRLQGREHRLITAVALSGPAGQLFQETDVYVMKMRALEDEALERYLRADEPFDCCGSYRIESRGIALFEAIEGSDFTSIVGLPMIKVVSMLRAAGFEVP